MLRNRIRPLAPTIWSLLALSVVVSMSTVSAQEAPPEPSAPKSVSIPAVTERKLPNGLTVAVVERMNVPLVTVQLLVRSGASSEDPSKAGLANLTAGMLTKGTKTRMATEIAEQIEFLGGSIETAAGWNDSRVSVTVTSDKLDKAMAIMADVVLNPVFDEKELDLVRSQALDGLTFNLKQPGFLANYVSSKYSFNEHPAGGTPVSLAEISASDVAGFHRLHFNPGNAVLIFAGDITAAGAEALGKTFFGKWQNARSPAAGSVTGRQGSAGSSTPKAGNRILVIDLPNSGQAAVSYRRHISSAGRASKAYYPSSVLNSLLGGGYSSRLNQEIRIKRGLSYGAGSNFGWRSDKANFTATTQTKNESAAEVTELVLAEIKRLTDSMASASDLTPRKSVLTGNFGRNLETTSGLAGAVAELYSFGIPTRELNSYVSSVNAVTDIQIRDFASSNLLAGDIVIVGDYSIFKDDLAKRFPNTKIDVIRADELDLSQADLRK